jgi:hypothetical protein
MTYLDTNQGNEQLNDKVFSRQVPSELAEYYDLLITAPTMIFPAGRSHYFFSSQNPFTRQLLQAFQLNTFRDMVGSHNQDRIMLVPGSGNPRISNEPVSIALDTCLGFIGIDQSLSQYDDGCLEGKVFRNKAFVTPRDGLPQFTEYYHENDMLRALSMIDQTSARYMILLSGIQILNPTELYKDNSFTIRYITACLDEFERILAPGEIIVTDQLSDHTFALSSKAFQIKYEHPIYGHRIYEKLKT